ncbi:ferredoxin [archaeon]|nr:ferredoxin [archaeon]|tara:strand:+ start:4759 stop:4959 length:201 start_codon:yes stop_codon:yes gene_type:complete
MFKITIDQEKCIGCGACEAVCSENFELKEINNAFKAFVKKEQVEEESCNKEAQDSCPVNCIKIENV